MSSSEDLWEKIQNHDTLTCHSDSVHSKNEKWLSHWSTARTRQHPQKARMNTCMTNLGSLESLIWFSEITKYTIWKAFNTSPLDSKFNMNGYPVFILLHFCGNLTLQIIIFLNSLNRVIYVPPVLKKDPKHYIYPWFFPSSTLTFADRSYRQSLAFFSHNSKPRGHSWRWSFVLLWSWRPSSTPAEVSSRNQFSLRGELDLDSRGAQA